MFWVYVLFEYLLYFHLFGCIYKCMYTCLHVQRCYLTAHPMNTSCLRCWTHRANILLWTQRTRRDKKVSVSLTLTHFSFFSVSLFPTCSESGNAASSSREAIWRWGGVGHLKVSLRHRQTYSHTYIQNIMPPLVVALFSMEETPGIWWHMLKPLAALWHSTYCRDGRPRPG